ncbi:MAG: hypothetical protein IPL61_09205 [Myxococcales bacterium]|nr:hypothetical protein [Myxococcales bacterium]
MPLVRRSHRALGMNTQRLDQIVRRQRSRGTRDVVLAVGVTLLVTLGLGALAASARGAGFAPAPTSITR